MTLVCAAAFVAPSQCPDVQTHFKFTAVHK